MWVLVCDQGFILFCSYFDVLMSKTQINKIDLFFLYRFRQTVPSHSVSSISSKTNVPLHSVGAEIVKRALSYPLKLTAKNAGVNGSVVSEKVVRCCLGHADSVAKTFFMSNCVVVEKGANTSSYWQPNEQFRIWILRKTSRIYS
ncbi:unnamed protein product [Brassica oleracea var. botrytis]|uniref:(rape) hypothetical protein n=1 Tax=Brassica napus TaxID=3708 RepID=A0A816J467_BRANA|nr:unnamed protein product [Brassica napus]